MSRADLKRLLSEGALERVEADPVTARQELDAARRHARSAEAIAADDAARNQSEYDALPVEPAEVVRATRHAHALIEAVESALRHERPTKTSPRKEPQ